MSAIFISHSSKDADVAAQLRTRLLEYGHSSIFLDFDPERGIPAGRNWERELYARLRACRAVIALCSRHFIGSQWCFAEVMQARALGKPVLPVRLDTTPLWAVLNDVQSIDFHAPADDPYQRLLHGLERAALDPAGVFDLEPGRAPYPGLLSFEEQDAAVYFGRDEAIQEGLETLNRVHRLDGARWLLVLGASGSGKSSLVRAGLIPRLKRDRDRWIVVEPFRPMRQPFDELALAVAATFKRCGTVRDWNAIRAMLNDQTESPDPAPLFALANELKVAAAKREAFVLLVVDQLEELLRAKDPTTASRFFRLLRAATEPPGNPFVVMSTLRSDFLGTLQNEPAMQGARYESVFVGRPGAAQFAQVVEGPARVVGLELGPGLVQGMVDDTAANDALPLLAFTLRELWTHDAGDGVLTLAEYEKLGRLSGSVAAAAAGAYDESALSAIELQHLRRAFRALVRLDAKGQLARQSARWIDLPADVHPILERFVQARLLVSGGEGTERILEVAHEALFRTWARLSEWLEADRQLLVWRNRLREDVTRWSEAGNDEGSLLRGRRLLEAEAGLADYHDELSERERAFINASVYARERDRTARERQRQRVLVGLGVASAIFLAIAGVAGWQWYDANQQRKVAEERGRLARLEQQQAELERQGVEVRQAFDIDQLAALVQAVTVGRRLQALESTEGAANVTDVLSPRFALQRILANIHEKYRLDVLDFNGSGSEPLVGATYDPSSETFLLTDGRTLQRSGFTLSDRSPLEMKISDVRVVAFSPDGRHIAAGSGGGIVQLIDKLDGISRAVGTHKAPLRQLAFDASGKSLAVIEASGRVRIWKLADDSFAEFDLFGAGSHPEDFCVTWSADGSEFVVVSSDGSIAFRSIAGQFRRSGAPWERRQGAVCSPVGSYFATAEPDGTVRLWNHSDTRTTSIALKGHHRSVEAMSFSADGEWLTTTGEDGTLRVWRVRARDVREFQGHDTEVERIAFSPKDDVFATAGQDDQVKVWDLTGRLRTQFSARHGIPRGIAFAPDGATIGTTGSDGKVRLWNVRTGRLLHEFTAHDDEVGWSVEFHPNRPLVVSAGSDNLAKLWDFSGKPIATLNGHQGFVWNAVFSPDGETVATASEDATVRLWRISGEEVRVLKEHRQRVLRVSFSPDGKKLATAGDEGVIIWNTNGELLAKFKGHYGWIYGASFSPDGKLFATAGEDGTVRTWSVLGYPLAEFNIWPALEAIQGMSFSHDGKLLATSADDGRIRLFALDDLNALLNQACDWLSGYLSADEADQLCPRIDRRQGEARAY